MAIASSTINDLFIALANPLRRQILRSLAAEREASPRELAEELAVPVTRLSYHVRVLVECGALELARTKRIRGCTQHFYRSAVEEKWALKALRESAGRGRKK